MKVKLFVVCAVLLAAIAARNVYRIANPHKDTVQSAQYVIVLGGGLKHGKLGKSAIERGKTAAEYMRVHPACRAVVSGGRGRRGDEAESTLLKQIIVASGIDKARVIEESQAYDTVENLQNSAMTIAKTEGISIQEVMKKEVVIVTSGYHLSRAVHIAKRLGYNTVGGEAAHTPLSAVPRSYIRETAAWTKLDLLEWRKR